MTKSLFILLAMLAGSPAAAQELNLGAAPVPVHITATGNMSWSADAQTVTAAGNAKAVRGDVTIEADQLIAHYLKQPSPAAVSSPAASPAAAPFDQGNAQLDELEASGNVHIFTATDNAWGDKAIYSLKSAVLVLTGEHLKLTTPQDTLTARDSVEYYANQHMAVARGNALITTSDGRSIQADVITAYFATTQSSSQAGASTLAGLGQGGALERVEAVGHVVVRTKTDIVTGDRGVYLAATQQARLGGNVHIIQGQNELAGGDALVNMKSGTATLLAGPGGQVSGTITPGSGDTK
ncbi:LptA/OstA family protein [Acidocella sp.]|uniref:LptA/OstA family protein n=1 Tax=Acidocella sp. TaxID=50710 RepID=UPI00261F3A5B|nr:LptA/OstA family protein [Acidocella sp.]